MRRRRFKRRLFWAAVILGLLVLALGATVAQAVVATSESVSRLKYRLAGKPAAAV